MSILPIVPLFHANGWGFRTPPRLPARNLFFSARTSILKRFLDANVEHGVTFAAGVPTIWLNVLCALEKYPDALEISTVARPVRRQRAAARFDSRARQARNSHHARVGHDRNVAARDRSSHQSAHARLRRGRPLRNSRRSRDSPCRSSSFASCVPKIPKMRTARKRSRLPATENFR